VPGDRCQEIEKLKLDKERRPVGRLSCCCSSFFFFFCSCLEIALACYVGHKELDLGIMDELQIIPLELEMLFR
jgi:hypothetical protein